MLLDDDETILNRSKDIFIAEQCADLHDYYFMQSINNTVMGVSSYRYLGKYDKTRLRSYFVSKESKFRKDIKKIGCTVSIWRDFHGGDGKNDSITFTFYKDGRFIFRIIEWFVNKNITEDTYGGRMRDYEDNCDGVVIDYIRRRIEESNSKNKN